MSNALRPAHPRMVHTTHPRAVAEIHLTGHAGRGTGNDGQARQSHGCLLFFAFMIPHRQYWVFAYGEGYDLRLLDWWRSYSLRRSPSRFPLRLVGLAKWFGKLRGNSALWAVWASSEACTGSTSSGKPLAYSHAPPLETRGERVHNSVVDQSPARGVSSSGIRSTLNPQVARGI